MCVCLCVLGVSWCYLFVVVVFVVICCCCAVILTLPCANLVPRGRIAPLLTGHGSTYRIIRSTRVRFAGAVLPTAVSMHTTPRLLRLGLNCLPADARFGFRFYVIYLRFTHTPRLRTTLRMRGLPLFAVAYKFHLAVAPTVPTHDITVIAHSSGSFTGSRLRLHSPITGTVWIYITTRLFATRLPHLTTKHAHTGRYTFCTRLPQRYTGRVHFWTSGYVRTLCRYTFLTFPLFVSCICRTIVIFGLYILDSVVAFPHPFVLVI